MSDLMLFKTQLVEFQSELLKVLPENVKVEKFERMTLTALQKNPLILNCDRKSLFQALTFCAQDGLVPDGKEAVLTKYGNQVVYLPMIGGILKKIKESNEIKHITSHLVCEKDEFEFWIDDDGEHLRHKPNLQEESPFQYVYATAKTIHDEIFIEVMTRKEIFQVKALSKGSSPSSPWNAWFDQMAKKTVIRRLFKKLPISKELETLSQRDDQIFDLKKSAYDFSELES